MTSTRLQSGPPLLVRVGQREAPSKRSMKCSLTIYKSQIFDVRNREEGGAAPVVLSEHMFPTFPGSPPL